MKTRMKNHTSSVDYEVLSKHSGYGNKPSKFILKKDNV